MPTNKNTKPSKTAALPKEETPTTKNKQSSDEEKPHVPTPSSSSSPIGTFFRRFIIATVCTIILFVFFVSATAACFTHRDPLAVYLEQHFMLDHAQRQQLERNFENNGKDPMDARRAFLSRPPGALSSHYFTTNGDDVLGASKTSSSFRITKETILENNRNGFCKGVIEPVVFATLFPFDGDYREHYGWLFELGDAWLLPRYYGAGNPAAAFLGRTFAALRSIDLFGTRSMLGDKNFVQVVKMAENETSSSSRKTQTAQKQKKSKTSTSSSSSTSSFKLCNFVHNSYRKRNLTSPTDFDNTLAQLFDFMTLNEMREIFPLRGDLVKKGVKVMSFDEFVVMSSSIDRSNKEKETERKSSSAAMMMIHYLRYLYSLPLIHQEEQQQKKKSSSFPSDLTFLGEFLNGVINIPSSAAENNFEVERIRFAYPENLENDGVLDCCDGSDEHERQGSSSSSSSSSTDNCHQQLYRSHFLIKDKLVRLSRAFQICIQRARNNKDRMHDFRDKLITQTEQLQPQYAALVSRFQELIPRYQKLHPLIASGQAKPKKQQLYHQIVMELQQIQQQLQQIQGFKMQADAMVSSANTGGFGTQGQLFSLFEHTGSSLSQIKNSRKKQEFYHHDHHNSASTTTTYNQSEETGRMNLILDRKLEELQSPEKIKKNNQQENFACLSKRFSNKEIAGGSADPSGGSDQEIKICPFRFAEGADVDALRKYAREVVDYEQKLEEYYRHSHHQSNDAEKERALEGVREQDLVSDDPDEEVRLEAQQQQQKKTASSSSEKEPLPSPPSADSFPSSKMLGMFQGTLSVWPAFALSGRKSFIDVLPQMPTRFAQARLQKAQSEFSKLAHEAFMKFQQQQKKRKNTNQQQQQQQQQQQFDPTSLFADPIDNVLAMRAQGGDAARLLHDLVNRSETAFIEKLTKQRAEYIQNKKVKLQEEFTTAQQQQEEKTKSDNNEEEQNKKQFTLPSDDELGAEWDKLHLDTTTSDDEPAYKIDNFIEHRWVENNLTEFLRTSSGQVAVDASFYRGGEACWEGPAERTMAVFYVCGEMDRIVDVREDGKCVYEAVIETPSACCHSYGDDPNSSSTSSPAKVVLTGKEVRRDLFLTRYPQRDNTLIRRYSIVERLLEMWL